MIEIFPMSNVYYSCYISRSNSSSNSNSSNSSSSGGGGGGGSGSTSSTFHFQTKQNTTDKMSFSYVFYEQKKTLENT